MSFRDLKRNSASQFEKINAELSKLNQQSFGKDDDRFWTCQTDKAGNGFAIIRFLPAHTNDDFPFTRIWSHGFKGPGGWYIENSLTTIGKNDPIGEYNSKLWNSGLESDKKIARDQKRKLSFYSNIYVIRDPANPENEGKVFLFRYGKKIYDKLNEMMSPPEDPIDPKDPVNIFDFWEGANFKLKIRQVEGYANYDKCEFESPSALFDDDDKLEEIYNSLHSLKELTSADKFKTYEELKARMNKVLGITESDRRRNEQHEDNGTSSPESPPFETNSTKGELDFNSFSDDDDKDLEWFRAMAED